MIRQLNVLDDRVILWFLIVVLLVFAILTTVEAYKTTPSNLKTFSVVTVSFVGVIFLVSTLYWAKHVLYTTGLTSVPLLGPVLETVGDSTEAAVRLQAENTISIPAVTTTVYGGDKISGGGRAKRGLAHL